MKECIIIMNEHDEKEYSGDLFKLDPMDHVRIKNIDDKVSIIKTPKGVRIRTHNYIGIVPLYKLKLLIKPKFKIQNVVGMINYCNQFGNIDDMTHFQFDAEKDNLDYMIIRAFSTEVAALQQKGMIRSYIPIIEDLPSLRGRLQLREQLINTAKGNVRFVCEHDEFTYDVFENRIILHCLQKCKILTTNPELYDKLNSHVNILSEHGISHMPHIDLNDFDRINYVPATDHYRSIHGLCRLIIKGTHVKDFYSGPTDHILSFLVDMNYIFELFVAKLFADHHDVVINPSEILVWNNDHKTTIEPDILIGKHEIDYIIDAKYKDISDKGLSREDKFQLAFYAYRLKKNRVYAVLPKKSKDDTDYIIGFMQN